MSEPTQDLSSLKHSFDHEATNYDSDTCTLAGIVNNYVNEYHILNHLKNTNCNRILDAGGGTGNFAIPLAEKGYDVTLVDISPKSLEIANQKALHKNLKLKII
jgi:2-polyprenyl-3-methyl-5-hydroxy-6-metoxy-1,4-benzoquinol methylase